MHKPEDAVENLRNQLMFICQKYNDELQAIIQAKGGDNIGVCVALYLATYIDMNRASKEYFNQNRSCVHLSQFCRETLSMASYNQQYLAEIQSSYPAYTHHLAHALQTESKLHTLLHHKKLFSPFWLLPPTLALFELG